MGRKPVLIDTIDGRGKLLEVESFYGTTRYHVAGQGFSGWYSGREVLSDLDEDETTTSLPFDKSTDDNGSAEIIDEEDPNFEDGVTLPWNPAPTEEWGDGDWNEVPDGPASIDLTPTKSTKSLDTSDLETSTLLPERNAAKDWDHELLVDRLGEIQNQEPKNWWAQDDDGYYTNPSHPNAYVEQNNEFNSGVPGNHWNWSNNGTQDVMNYENPQEAIEGFDKQKGLPTRSYSNRSKQAAFDEYIHVLETEPMVREAAWADVRAKAKRIFDGGDVSVESIDPNKREIHAKVDGDHGRYEVEIHRKNAFGQGVTWWDCDCGWGQHAYLRKRSFIGRMCSHALATYYAMQSGPKVVEKTKQVTDTLQRHTLATKEVESGLMVWDDDLHKVLKNLIPQVDPSQAAGSPAVPQNPALTEDPSGVFADPTMDPAQDIGAGPEESEPFFVRSANYPSRRAPRLHHVADNEDDDFKDVTDHSVDNDDSIAADFLPWDEKSVDDDLDSGDDTMAVNLPWDEKESAVHDPSDPWEDEESGAIDDDDYIDDDPDTDNRRNKNSSTDPRDDLSDWFEDDFTHKAALDEADEFNDNESQKILAEFHKNGGRELLSGKKFTFSEQQELIDEPGRSSYIDDLDLSGTHYI